MPPFRSPFPFCPGRGSRKRGALERRVVASCPPSRWVVCSRRPPSPGHETMDFERFERGQGAREPQAATAARMDAAGWCGSKEKCTDWCRCSRSAAYGNSNLPGLRHRPKLDSKLRDDFPELDFASNHSWPCKCHPREDCGGKDQGM